MILFLKIWLSSLSLCIKFTVILSLDFAIDLVRRTLQCFFFLKQNKQSTTFSKFCKLSQLPAVILSKWQNPEPSRRQNLPYNLKTKQYTHTPCFIKHNVTPELVPFNFYYPVNPHKYKCPQSKMTVIWKEIQSTEFQGSLVHLYAFMCGINRYNLESMALPKIWDYHWEEMTNWRGPSKQFLKNNKKPMLIQLLGPFLCLKI